MLNDQNKPYYTHHKQEAKDLVKSLNERFEAKEKEEYSELSLKEKVELEIKKCGYTWKFVDILDAFDQVKGGYYVSHTAKELVMKFYDEFEKY